jgi:hypothetical protein
MLRSPVFVVTVALAGCATQGVVNDWHLSEKEAIAIGNSALAANNFQPSKYRGTNGSGATLPRVTGT